jgi:hypothetical protein
MHELDRRSMLMVSILVLWVHLKVSSSATIRNAQRQLHLADLQNP